MHFSISIHNVKNETVPRSSSDCDWLGKLFEAKLLGYQIFAKNSFKLFARLNNLTTMANPLTTSAEFDLEAYCFETAQDAKLASSSLSQLTGAQKNGWLNASANKIESSIDKILQANEVDIARSPEFGLSESQIDRLRLTPARIASISQGLREVAMLPDPIGKTLLSSVRPNGLEIRKVQVPLGVVFFVFESRPNVTVDAAAICIKSGNSVILRGGKEAKESSHCLVEIMLSTADDFEIPSNAIQLVKPIDRKAVHHFLQLDQWIDVAIPRGGKSLIQTVSQTARMPVIKHFEGNCHVYVDEHADLEMAENIVVNAKCQRPGVCNACESLLIHKNIATAFLPRLCEILKSHGVELVGDLECQNLDGSIGPATDDDFAAEFLDLKLSICIVDGLDAAISHINQYGTGHTEAIITENISAAKQFCAQVDSSAVMVNASTRFNDGSQLGLGAEIGISTDKFHARGPCGLDELTSSKYICFGEGQVRE